MNFHVGRCSLGVECAAGIALLASILGCSPSEDTSGGPNPTGQIAASSTPAIPSEATPEETPAERGRSVYMANCIACHNPDPNLAGGVGPPIAASMRPLVESKVLRSEYPPGYSPKRDTRAMIPLPHLDREIDALVAFLADAAAD